MQEFVQFDDNLTQKINIVTSVFTVLVGKYHILNSNEEMKLKNQISVVIQKYKNSLKQHFDSVPSRYEGLLSKKQIMDAFIFMDIDFSAEQLDFIFLKLFALSNNPDLFPYSRLFEIFHWDDPSHKQEQQKFEKKKKKRESSNNRQFAFQGFDLEGKGG